MRTSTKQQPLLMRAATTLLLAMLTCATAWAWDGSGTKSDPYKIQNRADLVQLSTDINNSTSNLYEGTYFVQTADIDMSGVDFVPIGIDDNPYHRFRGNYDGKNYIIYNLTVNGSYYNAALFGYVNNGGIDNVWLVSPSITNTNTNTCYTGALIGYGLFPGIQNCVVINPTLSGGSRVGALAGWQSSGSIKYSYFTGNNNYDVVGYINGITGNKEMGRAYTLTLADGITTSTAPAFSYGGTSYYAGTITLPAAPAGWVYAYSVNGSAIDGNTFDISADASVTVDRHISPLLGYNDDPLVDGSADHPYTITTTDGWNLFCDCLDDNDTWNHFSGKTVKLGADITVTQMAGGSDHAFVGTFDGQGHTLTVNYGSASAPIDAEFVAPFVETDRNTSPTFRNLTIDGHIYAAYTGSSDSGVGGLIGHLFGTVTIEGCTSTVEINSTKDRVGGFVGLCEHAVTFTNCKSSAVVTCTGSGSGFVGWSRSSIHTIAFEGCLFDGKILKKNGIGDGNGGFVGWKGDKKIVNITNCLVDPAALDEGETMANGSSATFSREHDGYPATITNCYYTTAFGTAQGTQAYSISKGEYVTTLEISGTPTNSYPVSGLDFYSVGLKCGDVLYAAENDVVSLTLAHQDREGYDFIGYTATAGNLNGSSLTMPDGNVTINAEYTCTAPSELTVTDITFTTATLNWNGLQESYSVRYRTVVANEWQTIDNIAATTTTLSELLSGTTYEWQVQGLDCDGNGGTTEWSEAGTFTTPNPCEVQPSELTAAATATTATLNWNGLQESYSVRYRPAIVILNEGFESGTMPDGWTRTGSSYIENYQWQITSGTGNDNYTGAATGNFNAGCYINSYNSFDILITPVMDLGNVASATLSFNFWNTDWSGDINTLKVYYRVDRGEWHLLYTYGDATDRWIPVTINLEGLAANYQIGFECESHNSFGMGIDDVMVIGNGAWTTENNVLYPFTLTGLTPETQYLWQVQGLDCDGEGSTTEWSEMGIFTTPLHDPVAYIDANGQTQQCTDYTPLTGTETTLTAGWYVADDTLNYGQTITLSGDVHLILKDNAVMNVGTEETPVNGHGIYGNGHSISIYAQSMGESQGQLHLNASLSGYSGIKAENSSITINGGEVVVTSSGTYGLGIFANGGNITINGGNVEATSSGSGSIGIYTMGGGNVVINGGEVVATSSADGGLGIYASGGNITINGGEVSATSTGTDMFSYGIYASNGNITINSGEVTANGTCGIYVGGGDITISGGEVEATGSENGGEGIIVLDGANGGSISISNATVTATGSIGIHAKSGITINSGTVTANNCNYYGIYASNCSLTISGGQVTANGNSCGILCNNNITLGWTNASDYIHADSYLAGGTLSIAEGKAFIDEAGQTYSGTVAKVSGAYPIDGKWLYPNTVSRFTKTIAAHHTEEGVNYGWYLIASPLSGGTNAEAVAHLVNSETPANFDLYRFNQAAELEWENWKQQNSDHYHFNLEPGRGYLYANAADVNLVFAGTPYSGNGEVTITNVAGHPLSGWNLVGNPFSVDAYIGRDFYVLNEARSEVMPEASTGAIPSMEGVFVLAEQDEETVTFSTEALNKGRASKPEQVVLNLSRDRGLVIDRAIVRMGEGRTLPKFQLNRNSTKLYIPQDGTDYAIACAESTGEMPVNFKAETDGTYTISVNVDNVEMGYLHLIDNMTGTDVDLLFTQNVIAGEDPQSPAPSYTFTAKTTDYESRFRLVFVANGEDGSSTGSDTFAFISNGNIIVNGEGMLQVIDMTGRVLYTAEANSAFRIQHSAFPTPGVYVLRLINGEKVRTQKIVVE